MTTEAIFLTLNKADFETLVAGRSVVFSESRHDLRIEIRMRDVGGREMVHTVMGYIDALLEVKESQTKKLDPPEAQELSRNRNRARRRR
jgi:hypothetical protein